MKHYYRQLCLQWFSNSQLQRWSGKSIPLLISFVMCQMSFFLFVKILFCPSARAGPPGPPGPPGLPGRDGRDGRDCPPCNCGGGAPAAPLPPVESPCPGPSPLLPQGPSTGG